MMLTPQNACYSSPLWHVAYVGPRTERDVSDAIRCLGYQVSLPVERRWVVKRGRKVVDERPLFPGYVFAGVDPYREAWQRLLDVEGVIDVLGRPAADEARLPSHVPTAWIEAIARAEAAGIFDRTVNNASKFKVGERVRVSDGPFVGMTALIEEFIAKMRSATAKKRAKVLVDFMGRAMRFDVDVAQLEKI